MILLLSGAWLLAQQNSGEPSRGIGRVASQSSRDKVKTNAPVIPFEFRGIRLGMEFNEASRVVVARFPPGRGCGQYSEINCRDMVSGTQSCGVYTYCKDDSGDKTQFLNLHFVDGKLAEMIFQFPHDAMPPEWTRNSIGMSFDHYAGIQLALIDKYGTSRVNEDDVQTKAGAHYRSKHSIWDHSISTMELDELCETIDQSCLTMADKQLTREFYRRKETAQKPEI